MWMKKKKKKAEKIEDTLLSDIINLLEENLSDSERKILSSAKMELEKKSPYMPRIIGDLSGDLTFLAMKGQLSKDVGEFYLKISDSKFMNKNLGRGMIMAFSSMYH